MTIPSAYLPPDFDPSKPIAVVAGQKDYPKLTVESIRRAGLEPRLLALHGETSENLIESFPPEHCRKFKVGQIGRMLKALQQLEAGYVLFVGQVSPGKLFKNLSPDVKALSLLASLKERNAHTIFGAIATEIEKLGISMLDARAFIDDHLAIPGLMTSGKQKASQEDIKFGISKARQIADLDIGQGVVVRKGTVLAVEAFEGTDDMLSRANKYKTDRLVFVKTSKRQQNPYFDWPVFGEKTLEVMHQSGIHTAVLEAYKVVLLNRNDLIQKARRYGIELIGFSPEISVNTGGSAAS